MTGIEITLFSGLLLVLSIAVTVTLFSIICESVAKKFKKLRIGDTWEVVLKKESHNLLKDNFTEDMLSFRATITVLDIERASSTKLSKIKFFTTNTNKQCATYTVSPAMFFKNTIDADDNYMYIYIGKVDNTNDYSKRKKKECNHE